MLWITQLIFDSRTLINWEREVRLNTSLQNTLPIRIGMNGPASHETMLKIARAAGVANGLKFL